MTLVHQVTPTVEQDVSLGVYQRWLAGQEAFYACGTWDVAAFMDKETFPFNWDLCGYPTLSTGKSMTWLGTVGFCVSASSPNKKEATELISYLCANEDGQKELSGIVGGQSIQLPNFRSQSQSMYSSAIWEVQATTKDVSKRPLTHRMLNGLIYSLKMLIMSRTAV